ncbi:MAG: hypothetical protein IKZ88_01225 [Neisseriaceae bacterium]|nr:hypothetical protein [Neisseriaceae bacterium]
MAHNDSIFFWALLYLFSGSLKQRSTSVSEVIVDKLQNNNALARLAVLFILSAARRLLFF